MTVQMTICMLLSNYKTERTKPEAIKAYNQPFLHTFSSKGNAPSHELRTESRGLCCFCIKPQKTLTISRQILIMNNIDK